MERFDNNVRLYSDRMKLRGVVQPASQPRASNYRQCKDHFSITLSMSAAGSSPSVFYSHWVLGDHSGVAPTAMASATVHVVGMCCPLFVRVPEGKSGDETRRRMTTVQQFDIKKMVETYM